MIAILLLGFQSFSQVKTTKVPEDGIFPRPLKGNFNLKKVEIGNVDSLFQLLEEHLSNQDLNNDPFTFGKFVRFDLDFDTIESACQNGECFKEVEVELKEVNTLGFAFERIKLSKNAQFYLINDEEGYIQGPYTDKTLHIKENLISALMPGDKLRLLLVEPEDERNSSQINIVEASFGISDYVTSRVNSGP